jgi:hypothetical protein
MAPSKAQGHMHLMWVRHIQSVFMHVGSLRRGLLLVGPEQSQWADIVIESD